MNRSLLLLILLILLGGCFPLERSLGQIGPQGAIYQVTVEDPFEHLRVQGFRPVRVTITRLGPNARADSDETYFVGIEKSLEMSPMVGRRYRTIRRAMIRQGQTSVTVELDLARMDSYRPDLIVVSQDGSLASNKRSSLIAAVPLTHNGNFNQTKSNDVTFGFFGSGNSYDSTSISTQWLLRNTKRADAPIVYDTDRRNDQPLPKVQLLAQLLNQNEVKQRAQAVSRSFDTAGANIDLITFRENRFLCSASLNMIPEVWVGLQPLDVMVLSASDVELLANLSAEKTESVRQWVLAGGRLVVTSCRNDFSAFPSILPNLTSHQEPRPDRAMRQSWSFGLSSAVKSRNDKIETLRSENRVDSAVEESYDGYSERSYQDSSADTKSWTRQEWIRNFPDLELQTIEGAGRALADQANQKAAVLYSMQYGAGRILAVPGDLSDYGRSDWITLLAALDFREDLSVKGNIGMNHQYFGSVAGFQVPNVGEPPRLLFLVLITLFSIIVGPVAFVMLNRRNRINLVLFVVPFLSLLATLGLVGYVVIADGFAFRVSRLSFTRLDSINKAAMVQTSQAIYAGTSPGSYQFDRDIMFFGSFATSGGNFEQAVDAKQNVFSGGDLRVRTKHQATTISTLSTQKAVLLSKAKVDSDNDTVEDQADGGATGYQVTNRLGAKASLLVVMTPDGLGFATDVQADQTVNLSSDMRELESLRVVMWRELLSITDVPGSNSRHGYSPYNHGFFYSDDTLLSSSPRTDNAAWGRLSREFDRMSKVFPQAKLKVGGFYCVCDENDLAAELKPFAEYEYQKHVILGTCLTGEQ